MGWAAKGLPNAGTPEPVDGANGQSAPQKGAAKLKMPPSDATSQ